jgi:uncharacterized membrane protein
MFINNVDTVDLMNGLFNGDFYLYLRDENDTRLDTLVNYTFHNIGRWVYYGIERQHTRVISTFSFAPDTTGYPLDVQSLAILFTIEGSSIDQYELYPRYDLTGISSDLRLRGWNFSTTESWNASVTNRYFPTEKRTASLYTFELKITRPDMMAVKVFLPPAIYIISVLVSFSIPISQSITRLSIVTSALVAEVLFHNSITVPFTGAPMLADYFLYICYAIIVIATIENVILIYMSTKQSKKAISMTNYIESRIKYLVWLIFPFVYLFLFFEWWICLIVIICPAGIYFSVKAVVRRVRVVIEKRRKKREDISVKHDKDDEEFNQERGSRMEMTIASSQTVDVSKTDMRNEVLKKEIEEHDRTRNSFRIAPKLAESTTSDPESDFKVSRGSHVV